MNSINLSLIIAVFLLFAKQFSCVSIKVELLGYYNPNSYLYDGSRCETFHFFSDSCDPRCRVEVYNNYEMVAQYRSKTFDNINYISNMGSFYVNVKRFPVPLTFKLNIWDVDNHRDEKIMAQSTRLLLRSGQVKMIVVSNSHTSMTLRITTPYVYVPTAPPKPAKSAKRVMKLHIRPLRDKEDIRQTPRKPQPKPKLKQKPQPKPKPKPKPKTQPLKQSKPLTKKIILKPIKVANTLKSLKPIKRVVKKNKIPYMNIILLCLVALVFVLIVGICLVIIRNRNLMRNHTKLAHFIKESEPKKIPTRKYSDQSLKMVEDEYEEFDNVNKNANVYE